MTATHELVIKRTIHAPPSRIWQAWVDPLQLARWWLPAPMACKVVKLDVRPGGGFETLMREGDAPFAPHVEGCFLDVEPERRLVWTTVLREGWYPLEPWLALTAMLSFEPVAEGTHYTSRVLHRSAEDAQRHLDMGFQDGWGTVIDQLAAYLAGSTAA